MRKFALTWTILLITAHFCYSQESLTPIKAPGAPAAAIMGMNPGSVFVPKSYQELELSVFSNFLNEGDFSVPDNFAIEVSPYWFGSHNLNLKELLESGFWAQIWQNSSFSLASTRSYILRDEIKSSGLGLGYRTHYFIGSNKDNQKFESLKNSLNDYQSLTARLKSNAATVLFQSNLTALDDEEITNIMTKFNEVIEDVQENYSLTEEAVSNFKFGFQTYLSAKKGSDLDITETIDYLSELSDNILDSNDKFYLLKDFLTKREGFGIDFSTALFVNFPTNKFNHSFVPKYSFWLAPSYSFDGGSIGFLTAAGVIRYQVNHSDFYMEYFPETDVFKNNLDYGFALNSEFNRITIQFEITGRHASTEKVVGTDEDNHTLYIKKKESDIQYLGSFSYRITDKIELTYKIGSNFKNEFTSNNEIINLLAINFGFGGLNKKNIDFE